MVVSMTKITKMTVKVRMKPEMMMEMIMMVKMMVMMDLPAMPRLRPEAVAPRPARDPRVLQRSFGGSRPEAPRELRGAGGAAAGGGASILWSGTYA